MIKKIENKININHANARRQHEILNKLDDLDLRFFTEEDLMAEFGDFGVPETNYVLHRTFELGWHFPKLLTHYLSGGARKISLGRQTLLGEHLTAEFLWELRNGKA